MGKPGDCVSKKKWLIEDLPYKMMSELHLLISVTPVFKSNITLFKFIFVCFFYHSIGISIDYLACQRLTFILTKTNLRNMFRVCLPLTSGCIVSCGLVDGDGDCFLAVVCGYDWGRRV